MTLGPTALNPDLEARRIEALRSYDILDTPRDGAFDRVTALVAELLKVPIAVISLVDTDRIWFKSTHGLDATEVDRAPGLCASAVLGDGPYVLEDASADPRALTNPLVAGELGLRFYAGVPLRTARGYNLGMLVALDVAPRAVSERELRILTDLAQMVMDQMELRLSARRVAELHEELARVHDDLKHRSRLDPLTGIDNHGAIVETLERVRALAHRECKPMALMVADIDRFKEINDTWGHLVGDEVLREVTRRLQGVARSSDAVGRLGGDEFLIVMYPCDLTEAEATAERFRSAVSGTPIDFSEDGGGVHAVTLSAGVHSGVVADGEQARHLLRNADVALYEAKRLGRDRIARSSRAADGLAQA